MKNDVETQWTPEELELEKILIISPETVKFMEKLGDAVQKTFESEEGKRRFADNLRLLMTLKRFKILRLSKMTGIDRGYISKVLNRKAHLSGKSLILVAQALQVRPTSMLGEDFAKKLETFADIDSSKEHQTT